MRLKKLSSPMPRLRAMSMSGLVSELNVTMPCTSAGARPASFSARSTASTARRSSERPEALENSVAPMPAMATRPANACGIRLRPSPRPPSGRITVTVPLTWSPRSLAPRTATFTMPVVPSSPSGPFSMTEPVIAMVQSG